MDVLSAISPIDGRYYSKTSALSDYFSEEALIKYRFRVELQYLLSLEQFLGGKIGNDYNEYSEHLTKWIENFGKADVLKVKEIEKVTNHDVKAVEYLIKQKVKAELPAANTEWVHFGLTSQDINNTAVPLSLLEAKNEVLLPALREMIAQLGDLVKEWSDVPLLARTHGQPASPTRLGKELEVFTARLDEQIRQLEALEVPAKFGGATGNFNAHFVAFPDYDWHQFGRDFVKSLGLKRSEPTTQIEHYDNLAAFFDVWRRINVILIDFSRDIWTYIAFDYFKQKIKKGEVGSSAMPHKVNPIDFENAEGNLGIANAVLNHLSEKLPISRLQRDLTDSTVLRNIGVPFAHIMVALASLNKGMSKLVINREKIDADLEKNWVVVAEAIQTLLRAEGMEGAYEQLLELSRTHKQPGKDEFESFINKLEVADELKQRMRSITPFNYTGG